MKKWRTVVVEIKDDGSELTRAKIENTSEMLIISTQDTDGPVLAKIS